jgi:hypothetical protein
MIGAVTTAAASVGVLAAIVPAAYDMLDEPLGGPAVEAGLGVPALPGVDRGTLPEQGGPTARRADHRRGQVHSLGVWLDSTAVLGGPTSGHPSWPFPRLAATLRRIAK